MRSSCRLERARANHRACPVSQSWVGTPCIYVLDCSAAGLIINAIRQLMEQRNNEALRGMVRGLGSGVPPDTAGGDGVRVPATYAGDRSAERRGK